MIYKYLLITILICFQAISHAGEPNESDQIFVRLGTEKQLFPLYLSRIVDEGSGFENSYLKKLEDVLRFDLSNNGMTTALPNTSERDQLAAKGSINGSDKKWQGIYYVVKLRINSEKKPVVTVIPVNGDSAKSLEGKPLAGDLGKDRKQIHQLADAIYKSLFATDGIATTHILYSYKKNSDNWAAEIWETDYDGANAKPIIHDDAYNITPSYIPPKAGFAAGSFFYVSYKNSQPKIFLATLKEGVGRRLTSLKGNQLMPAITRQRDQMAFICDITGNPDLFLQDFNVDSGPQGKPRQIFSSKKATQGTPTFSPDGERIAFVTNKDGAPKIYVMNIPPVGMPLKNLRPQLINKHTREASAPAWSPDGEKIAYCAMTNGVREIWLYDFNTNEERQLTQGGDNKENPTWAPNSLCLMYNVSDPGKRELYMITINQPKPVKISLGTGEKRFPSWEPR